MAKWVGWTLFGLGSAGLLALAFWAKRKALGSVTGGDDRVDASGFVPGDPTKLAAAAGASLEEYALARCMESEESSVPARTAIGWAMRNLAQSMKISISALLLRPNGHFGRQDIPVVKKAATSKPPTAATLALAKKIFAKSIPDPTGGATQWDAPKAQAANHARNPKKFKSPEEIAARRIAAGNEMAMVPGVPATRFWRKRGAA